MVQEELKTIWILCGPTAVGKTRFALELATKLRAEIISADSGQVWKGLDIGTAKPSSLERAQIPHHLIDVVEPSEHFDASCFVRHADEAVSFILGCGKIPLVVGGTGLYIQALLYDLCEAPPQDACVRRSFAERVDTEGLATLYEEAKRVDPEAAQKIHPNDPTRILRLLEVHALTGKPLSFFHRRHQKKPRYKTVKIGLACDRQRLHEKIEKRIDWMIANGWAEEVRELLKFYPASSQAFRTIGYKQMVAHLQGKIPLEETVAAIKQETKQYAKRQETWFHKDKEIRWVSGMLDSILTSTL